MPRGMHAVTGRDLRISGRDPRVTRKGPGVTGRDLRIPPGALRSIRLISALLGALLVASGCATGSSVRTAASGSSVSPGSSSSATAATTGPSYPMTVTAAGGDVVIAHRPARIVSLSPTATEMLFAVGAGPQVVAVDADSTYPPQAPRTELSGVQPNVEAIAKENPDLVVISNDIHDLMRSLRAVSIPTLLEPAAGTLDDTYAQIAQLGTVTGHEAEAEGVVSSMRAKIQQLVASAPAFDHRLTYYHELDQTYFTATSTTFIGRVYALVGLRNIADGARGTANGYPQLSAEYVVKANPDLVFLADTRCCGQSAATVARRPGWARMDAVRDDAVVPLDDDVASRWGPRVVDFLRAVVDALNRLHQRAAA
jgi:iron complex transport system substrate-binding protein